MACKTIRPLSINIADEALLLKAGRAVCISGAKTGKGELFDYAGSDAGVPMTARAPIPGEGGKTVLSGAAGVRKAESPICRQDGKEVRW